MKINGRESIYKIVDFCKSSLGVVIIVVTVVFIGISMLLGHIKTGKIEPTIEQQLQWLKQEQQDIVTKFKELRKRELKFNKIKFDTKSRIEKESGDNLLFKD